jgi:hypothetical protein
MYKNKYIPVEISFKYTFCQIFTQKEHCLVVNMFDLFYMSKNMSACFESENVLKIYALIHYYYYCYYYYYFFLTAISVFLTNFHTSRRVTRVSEICYYLRFKLIENILYAVLKFIKEKFLSRTSYMWLAKYNTESISFLKTLFIYA